MYFPQRGQQRRAFLADAAADEEHFRLEDVDKVGQPRPQVVLVGVDDFAGAGSPIRIPS